MERVPFPKDGVANGSHTDGQRGALCTDFYCQAQTKIKPPSLVWRETRFPHTIEKLSEKRD